MTWVFTVFATPKPFWMCLACHAVLLLALGFWFLFWEDTGGVQIADALARFDRLRSIAIHTNEISSDPAKDIDREFATIFLKDGPEAVVSAHFLNQLNDLAMRHGVAVVRATEAEPISQNHLTLLGEDVELSGKLSDVYGFVEDVEASRPYILVEYINISVNGQPGGTTDEDAPVAAHLRLFGARSPNPDQTPTTVAK